MASAPADSSFPPPFFVYILRCSDNSLYIGHASNLPERINRHNQGRGAASIASRLPVELVYQESQPTEAAAIRRGLQLKRWTHAKKFALINGDRAKLKSLAKRRMGRQPPLAPIFRRIEPGDSLDDLTLLLHRAYAPLAERGMRFFASHQTVEQTRERIGRGECFVAVSGGRIIGTVTWRGASRTNGSPWYDRPDVASCGQFAVEPAWQRRGVGSTLLGLAERRTAEAGAAELALDTAETADHLIRFYTSHGFRFIEHIRWDVVNYRSVVLSKRVGGKEKSGICLNAN